MRVQGRRAVTIGAILACAFFSAAARADVDADTDARAAYDRGLVAHERGDELEAARDFADADRASPSSAALEAALSSAMRAGDAVFVMKLVLRARGRELDPSAKATAARAKSQYEARVVVVEVDCGRAVDCRASIDGGAADDADRPLVVLPGRHAIAVTRDGATQNVTLTTAAGATTRILAPSVSVPQQHAVVVDDAPGWKKPVALAMIGASVVLAGVTVASAVDSAAKRSDFNRDHCGTDAPASTIPAADCSGLADAGKSAETRTDVLLASAAVVTAATVAFVLVAHPFASHRTDVTMTASAGGASLAVRFP